MSTNPLVNFMAWTFVPSFATRFLHSVYYSLTIRAGDPKPQPGSPQYRKHYQRIYATLILCYLGYTIVQVLHDLRIQSDFYVALDVPHYVDEKVLRSKFRRLAAQYHPDKVGSSGPAHDFYVSLQVASETLLDPVKRFAYDRLGPDILKANLPGQAQVKDYLSLAFMQSAPSYAASAAMLAVLGFTGYLQYGRFWRYLAFGALVLLECYMATRPYYPWVLYTVVNPLVTGWAGYPPLLPFQFMALARKMTFNLFIAISQLGPLLEEPSAQNAAVGKEVETQQLARLEQIVRMNELEASRLLALEMTPFVGDDASQRELKNSVKEWLVQNTIRADPEVRQRVAVAVQHRQGESAHQMGT